MNVLRRNKRVNRDKMPGSEKRNFTFGGKDVGQAANKGIRNKSPGECT